MFPRTVLPDLLSISGREATGRDADGNLTFGWTTKFDSRIARFYRDEGVESPHVKHGVIVRGMVATRHRDGDDPQVEDTVEIKFSDGNVQTYDLIHARLVELWNKPSHWEMVLADPQ